MDSMHTKIHYFQSTKNMDKHDPDIKVFAKTANCIFELENMELDNSMILGDDIGDFLPEFKWEKKCIYIEGLAALFHTGNLVCINA